MQIKVFKRTKAILFNDQGNPCECIICSSANNTQSVKQLNEWIKQQKAAHPKAEVIEC